MSTLRPGAVQDPDTSFEEIDTTIEVGREMKHHKTEGPSGDDMKPQLPKLLPPLTKGYMEPTVPSTISSPGSTTLSGKDNNRFSTYTESDGQEFLEDFEEFDSEKKVDQWLQMKDQDFDLESYKEDDEDDGLSELRSELENRLAFGGVCGVNNDPLALTNDGSLGTGDTRPSISAKGDTLLLPPKRHQKRDQAFEAAKQRNARQHLPLSRSYMNLRPSGSSDETNDSRLRYKKSMPSLSHFKNNLIPECDERSKGEELFYYDDDNFAEGLGLDAKPSRRFDERKLKKSGLVTPQFIEDEDPLNLSPSQYTIIRDDTLLTPQLHRQQQKQKYNLDAFKEVDHRRKRNTHGKKSASYRLRTIKQEIDHNTPIRAGNMSYNPKLKKWEGNEEILERFKTLDSEETYRALLITKNASRESPTRARYSNSSRKNHGKVVGKMVFDEKNLRWLSLEGGEVDPFGDITETIKAKPLPLNYQSSKSVKFQRAQSQPAAANRAHSSSAHAPTRYHSFAQYNKSNPTFHISGKQLEKFYHEEQRWVRKIGGWFNSDDSDNTKNVKNRKGHNDQAYMYEIRNMVMNSARN